MVFVCNLQAKCGCIQVRLRLADGNFELTHMDEIIDQMLNNEYLFDVALPRIPNRRACSFIRSRKGCHVTAVHKAVVQTEIHACLCKREPLMGLTV